MRPWLRVRRTFVRDFRVLRVYDAVYRDPRDGRDHDRVILEASDWITVLAVTPADEVVLVRQFRFGIEAASLECPGGILDEDEPPERAALRELEEETGYRAAAVRRLGAVHANPALHTNQAHLFLATGCQKAHEGRPDAGEDLEVVLAPRSGIDDLVRRGGITHPYSLNALYLASLEGSPARSRR